MAEGKGPDRGIDAARVAGLGEALAVLTPALEAFVRRRAGADSGRGERLAALRTPLPARGLGSAEVLERLNALIVDGLPIAAPGFMAFVNSAPPVVPSVAQLVAAISAPSRWWSSPGAVLEELAMSWLMELFSWPTTGAGSLVSGGAVATLTALAAAREAAGARQGVDVGRDGVAALEKPRIYAGDNVHGVAGRALALLGLGRRALVTAPSSPSAGVKLDRLMGRIDQDRAEGCTAVAVIATAGDASTGAIDDLPALVAACRARGVWLHVDASYGGFAIDDPRVAPRLAALAEADSVVVDPHKWLAVPAGVGAVLVRERRALSAALRLPSAAYLGGSGGESPFDLATGRPAWTPEHSAPARGLVVWAALAEIGRDGLRARVSRHLDLARQVAARVQREPSLELAADPVLSTVVFRARGPDRDRLQVAVVRAVRARGRVIPSLTRVHGAPAIRACFLGVQNSEADADALVDEVLAVLPGLTEE